MPDLSEEERDILTQFADGFDLGTIAQDLGVGRTHVSAIVGPLCRYDKSLARHVLAGGELPPVEVLPPPPPPPPPPPAAREVPAARSAPAKSAPTTPPPPETERPRSKPLERTVEPPPPGPPVTLAEPTGKRRGRAPRPAARPVEPPPPSGPLVDPIVVAGMRVEIDPTMPEDQIKMVAPRLEPGAFGSVPVAPPGPPTSPPVTRAPRLVAAAAVADPQTITSYVQWWCLDCGGQYCRPFRARGAPSRCDGQLERVLVTVTRLDGPP